MQATLPQHIVFRLKVKALKVETPSVLLDGPYWLVLELSHGGMVAPSMAVADGTMDCDSVVSFLSLSISSNKTYEHIDLLSSLIIAANNSLIDRGSGDEMKPMC